RGRPRGRTARGGPPRRTGHTRPRRMTRPYRLTPLPWPADPLPGLLAIRDLGHPVLLDSAASEDPRGHYSILAAGPIQLISAADNESGLSTIQRLRPAAGTRSGAGAGRHTPARPAHGPLPVEPGHGPAPAAALAGLPPGPDHSPGARAAGTAAERLNRARQFRPASALLRRAESAAVSAFL